MNLKGQGTTEYLIILVVIIVFILVVTGIMGWFPKFGTGPTEQQSRVYWQSAAPLAIKDWKVTSTATDATFSVQNMTTNKIIVTEITIDNMSIGMMDTNIAAGDLNRSITGSTGVACNNGSKYQFDATISYEVISGISGKTQTGLKPIVGICP